MNQGDGAGIEGEVTIAEALPLARRERVGTVCFKTFGAGKLLGDTSGYGRPLAERPQGKFRSDVACEPALPHLSVAEAVHYTLTCDPDVALLGMSFPNGGYSRRHFVGTCNRRRTGAHSPCERTQEPST